MEDNEIEFNEYNDADATDCANGDYNTFEENQLALDNEHDNGDNELEVELEDAGDRFDLDNDNDQFGGE